MQNLQVPGGGGVCQTGFRKAHVREDPPCRLHGVTGGTGRPTQPRLGEQADRLAHIVDHYMPKIADEGICHMSCDTPTRSELCCRKLGKHERRSEQTGGEGRSYPPQEIGARKNRKNQRRAEEHPEPKTTAGEATVPRARNEAST